ncbi:DUF2804 domain-containing protein [Gracilinema caldarium]|uniref:DUF2804 domain-containing protein n=1 Tax=Gracilinema caldarium TaxID=215591 RepID=UPI0026F34C40|nr:DUF2804 domain-containing protein [Gracilinema caldarium]
MYQRDISPPRSSPLDKGIPVFGTWTRPFDDVDLLSVKHPFFIPTMKWIRNLRVKEWQTFHIQNETYFLIAVLTNAKYYRLAQVFLWNKETKESLLFRKSLPFGAWKLPRSLSNSSITSRSYGFYFRIHNWLDADLIELDLDIEPKLKRPSFTAHLEFDFSRLKTTPLVTCLPFAERRCMYNYKAMVPVRGDLVFGGKHVSLSLDKTFGFFMDYKGYFPYRMRQTWCTGHGFHNDGRPFGFSVVESQTRDSFRYNENGLWLAGQLTPLPPVRITMPEGPDSDWVIQDLEGMVDLTFTPKEPIKTGFDFIITRSEYISPFGVYNGMLQTKDGEKINLRNVWGTGEQIYLRV